MTSARPLKFESSIRVLPGLNQPREISRITMWLLLHYLLHYIHKAAHSQPRQAASPKACRDVCPLKSGLLSRHGVGSPTEQPASFQQRQADMDLLTIFQQTTAHEPERVLAAINSNVISCTASLDEIRETWSLCSLMFCLVPSGQYQILARRSVYHHFAMKCRHRENYLRSGHGPSPWDRTILRLIS